MGARRAGRGRDGGGAGPRWRSGGWRPLGLGMGRGLVKGEGGVGVARWQPRLRAGEGEEKGGRWRRRALPQAAPARTVRLGEKKTKTTPVSFKIRSPATKFLDGLLAPGPWSSYQQQGQPQRWGHGAAPHPCPYRAERLLPSHGFASAGESLKPFI